MCHRIGKKGAVKAGVGVEADGTARGDAPKNPRQITVRFVSRRSIIKVYKQKIVLKDMDKHEDVFITDDLTQLRMKPKSIVKDTEDVPRSIDMNIHCKKGGVNYVICDPDDLLILGLISISRSLAWKSTVFSY